MFPLAIVIAGLAMALLLGLTTYLAQTTRLRTRQLEATNRQLGREIEQRRRAEQAINALNRDLERRVAERTAQFQATNQELEAEIAERRRTEEGLREPTARLAEAQHLARLGSWEWDVGTNEVRWSDELFRLFGIAPQQFGATFEAYLGYVYLADRERVRQDVEKALHEQGTFSHECRFVKPDGTVWYNQARGETILDEAGHVVKMRGTAQDITDRKNAETELEREREFLKAVLENIDDGIVACNAAGVLTLFNRATRNFHGLPEEPLPSEQWAQHFDLYLSDGETLMQEDQIPLYQALQGQHPHNTEMVIAPKHKPGSARTLLASGQPIHNALGEKLGAVVVMHDISERKLADQALQVSEARYRHMFTSSPLPMWVYDIETLQFLEVNEAATVRYGYTREEFLSMRITDIRPEDAIPRLLEDLTDLGLDMTMSNERRHRLKSGQIIEVQIAAHRLTFGGRPAVLSVATDITERKLAEQIRLESAQRYKQMFEANGSVQWLLDPHTGAIVEANKAASDFYGYSLAQLTRMNITDINVSLGAQEYSSVFRVMSREPARITSRHRLASGEIRDVEGYGGPIDLGGRRLIHGIIFDITERKQAQEQLQKSEGLYRALASNLPNGAVLLYDSDLRFQLAEGMSLHKHGYAKDRVEGKTVSEVLPPARAADLLPYYQAALAGHESTIERNYAGIDYLILFVPVKNQLGETYAGMVVSTDITERKRAEEGRRAKEAAEAANRAKSEFLSRMSHELRTPLNAILGFAQLLDMDPLEAEQHQSLDYIVKAGRHLLGLIDEVLDISRIEAGAISLSIEPVPLDEVLQESLDLARSIAAQHNVALHVEIQEGCKNTHIASDRQRVKQVLLNLLANAVKYNHAGGGVTITCERIEARPGEPAADPRRSPPAGTVRVDVADTGSGIAPEKIARLFTPFDRLGAEHTAVEGTGLGLSVAKHLVEAMGGTISVHSTLGEGSVFSVELPVVAGPSEGLDQQGDGSVVLPAALVHPRTLLYIEDNLSNLKLVERILEHSPGVNLLATKQGSIGLQLAQEHAPDLILLDLHLSDMLGDEVLRRLRADPRTRAIPVVMISADATTRQIERLLAAGATAYLTKPLDVKKFLAIVGEALKGQVGVR